MANPICSHVSTTGNLTVVYIQHARLKLTNSLGKVISNYPLLTIDTILAHFIGCKYFSTIDLRLCYYHIKLSKGAAEKTAYSEQYEYSPDSQ